MVAYVKFIYYEVVNFIGIELHEFAISEEVAALTLRAEIESRNIIFATLTQQSHTLTDFNPAFYLIH